MKFFVALLTLLLSSFSFAYGPSISNWSEDLKLKQEQASELLFDFYIFSVLWEDEGFECGGEFSNVVLDKVEDEVYYISGNVSVVQDYCAYTSTASFQVKMQKIEDKFEVEEISFKDEIIN